MCRSTLPVGINPLESGECHEYEDMSMHKPGLPHQKPLEMGPLSNLGYEEMKPHHILKEDLSPISTTSDGYGVTKCPAYDIPRSAEGQGLGSLEDWPGDGVVKHEEPPEEPQYETIKPLVPASFNSAPGN